MAHQRTAEILEAAARGTWRVFTRTELIDLGLSPQRIRALREHGQLHEIHRGVYVYGHRDLAWRGEMLAAQHAGGTGAYLTWGSGLALHGLWRPYTRLMHVTTLTRRRSRPTVVMHETDTPPEADELVADGPLSYARLPRLLLEFARGSNEAQLGRLITKAVQQDKLDHSLMRAVLERYGGRPGAGVLTSAYRGYLIEPRAKSELEGAFDRALAERPWIPRPLANHYIEAGGIRWEIDRYWPERRVGVEIDSRTYHQALRDRAKDELKRAKLLTIGIQTLSVSDWRMDYAIADCLDDLELVLDVARRR